MAKAKEMTPYQERLQKGLCPYCGGKRDTDFIKCSKCIAYFREYQRRYREKNADYRRWQADYRRRNRKNGLCPGCGREIGDKRFKQCAVCRGHTLKYYHENKGISLEQMIVKGAPK